MTYSPDEDSIILAATIAFNCTRADLVSTGRTRPLPTARMFAWAVGRCAGLKTEELGEWFDRSHAAVVLMLGDFKEQMKRDEYLAQRWMDFKAQFPGATGRF